MNNAVVRHFAPVEEFAPEQWDEALAVNLSAPFHLIRLALPAMKKRGWGRIINMASIYSTRAVADRIDYVTTKTAIVGMTRAVAIETAHERDHLQRALPGHAADTGHPAKDCIALRPAKAAPSTRRRATISRHASRPGGSSPWRASAPWSSSCASPAATGHHGRDAADRRGLVRRMSANDRSVQGGIQWLKHRAETPS